MNKVYLFCLVSIFSLTNVFSQDLPHWMTAEEQQMLPTYLIPNEGLRGTDPPDFTPRASAEWEEIDALMVTWTSYTSILKQIIDAAQEECIVYVICTDSNSVKTSLTSSGIPLTNVKFVIKSFNSIWCRDYGPWNIYNNDVEELSLVDWIYNRPRPLDDVVPGAIATKTGLPIYQTISAPNDLVNTGGNFMTDGHNTAFASKLVLDDNGPGGDFNITVKSEATIKGILADYMGIDRYVLMETLPFDEIHHIDMHMKLLDEETILVGQFPTGISDGPQIEENIQYIQDNFLTCYGRPYKIVRIPMPPSTTNKYAPSTYYRTYTNSVFVNKTLIIPTYREEYDTTAIRIYKENLPGYKIVPIDCDDGGAPIISALGAIHCITKEVASGDPLWISHAPLEDRYASVNPILVETKIKTPSGVNEASLFWTTDTSAGYNEVAMTAAANDTFYAYIPAQNAAGEVFYYIHAESNSGRSITKPLTAPAGYWKFEVLPHRLYGNPIPVALPEGGLNFRNDDIPGNTFIGDAFHVYDLYPNPSNTHVNIGLSMPADGMCSIVIRDVLGKEIATIHDGALTAGIHKFTYNVQSQAAGLYFVEIRSGNDFISKKLMVGK